MEEEKDICQAVGGPTKYSCCRGDFRRLCGFAAGAQLMHIWSGHVRVLNEKIVGKVCPSPSSSSILSNKSIVLCALLIT